MKSFSLLALSLLLAAPSFGADTADKKSPPEKIISTAVLRTRPDVKYRADPVYPQELAKRGDPGTATIEFVITEKGEVKDVKVIEASHPAFGIAARDAVLRSVFKPGISRDGQPVAVKLQVPFTFTPPKKS